MSPDRKSCRHAFLERVPNASGGVDLVCARADCNYVRKRDAALPLSRQADRGRGLVTDGQGAHGHTIVGDGPLPEEEVSGR